MKRKLSRRVVSAALIGVPGLAQTPLPAPPKPQETAPAAGENPRAAASRNVQSTAAVLRKFEIALETEPAFRFRP